MRASGGRERDDEGRIWRDLDDDQAVVAGKRGQTRINRGSAIAPWTFGHMHIVGSSWDLVSRMVVRACDS